MKQGWCCWLLRAFILTGLLLTFGACSRVDASPRSASITPSRVVTATRDSGTRSPVPVTPTRTVREVITTAVANRPADFAFAFIRTSCGESETLDTFAGAFALSVPQDGRYRGGTHITPLTLSSDEQSAIYQQLLIMDLFDNPPVFPTTRLIRGGWLIEYSLRVRHAGREQSFYWDTAFGLIQSSTPTLTRTDRDLELLAWLIRSIAYDHPEVQSLPRGVGCT